MVSNLLAMMAPQTACQFAGGTKLNLVDTMALFVLVNFASQIYAAILLFKIGKLASNSQKVLLHTLEVTVNKTSKKYLLFPKKELLTK